MTEFTAVIPDRSRRASSAPRALEYTADPSSQRVALASVTASSMLATLFTVTVGPKVSSFCRRCSAISLSDGAGPDGMNVRSMYWDNGPEAREQQQLW